MRHTAFVAGATGYTGRHVVAALRASAIATHAHVRPDSAAREQWTRRFAQLGAVTDTTPWQPAAMAETIRRIRPTLVFALLGTTRARRRHEPDASWESVDYGLTHMLLAAVRTHTPDALFVYLSAIGATDRSRSRYVAARGRIEQELRDSRLACLVARPAFITGPDRDEARPAERIGARTIDALLALARVAGLPGLERRFRSLTGAELGTGLVRLALAGRTGVVGPAELRLP